MKPDSDSPANHQWEKGLAYNIIETEKKIEFCLVIMLIWICFLHSNKRPDLELSSCI